jgi:hypothetical protein
MTSTGQDPKTTRAHQAEPGTLIVDDLTDTGLG